MITKTVAAVFISLTLFAPVAHADDDGTAPSPYQIGPNPQLPGNQTYAPVCAHYPPACGLHFDIGTETWQR